RRKSECGATVPSSSIDSKKLPQDSTRALAGHHPASEGCKQERGARADRRFAMSREPELRAFRGRPGIEVSMRTVIARHRRIEIVRALADGLVGVLARIRHSREIVIEESWEESIGENRFGRGPTDPEFAPAVSRGPVDSIGRDFWLKNR